MSDSEVEVVAENENGKTHGFRQLAFIIGVVLILGAWKFGLEGLMD